MQRIEDRTFGEHAEEIFAENKPVAVEQHGHVIGYYIPARPLGDETPQDTMQRWREAVQQALAESGMTEDEFADALLIGDHDWEYYAPRR